MPTDVSALARSLLRGVAEEKRRLGSVKIASFTALFVVWERRVCNKEGTNGVSIYRREIPDICHEKS